jgi:hypothetical protein
MFDTENSNIETITPPGQSEVTSGIPAQVTSDNTDTHQENETSQVSEGAEAIDEVTSNDKTPEPQESEASLDDLPLPDPLKENRKDMPKWVEKKLSKRDRDIQIKEQEIALLRQQIAAAQQGQSSQPLQAQVAPPKREDFTNEDDYLDARLDYREKARTQQRQLEHQHQSLYQAEMTFQHKLKNTLDSGSEKYDDFEDVVQPLFSPSFPPNRAMAEAIVDSEHKSDILYFLAKYQEKALEIAKLSPVQAVKKIAEIEARFHARKTQGKTSQAPAPMERIKTNSSAPVKQSIDQLAAKGDQKAFEAELKAMSQQHKPAW